MVKDCFTGQSPGKAKSKPRLLRGGLGHDWCAGGGLDWGFGEKLAGRYAVSIYSAGAGTV